MTTNLSKLKGKGAPPMAERAPDVIANNPRTETGVIRPLQFRVTESVFDAFSERAGRDFGFNKGSKSQLFLKMWELYQKHGIN